MSYEPVFIQKLRQLFTLPTQGLGKGSRFLALQVRVWFHCFRLLGVNHCLTQAAALAYHSIFGLVPLAIVILMIFQMFPANREAGERVKKLLYESLNLTHIEYPVEETELPPDGSGPAAAAAGSPVPAAGGKITVAAKLDELIERYMSKLNTGAITGVGLVLVIWAAIGLLTTIERTFNTIYHVPTGRSFLHRLFNYWALLTLGPLLIGAGLYVSARYLLVHEFSQGIFAFLGPTIPFAISIVGFFFLYYFLPNTRISPGAALWGAFVATILWTAAKYGLRVYMSKVVLYQAIYGILGIIPLTVFWIFLSWLIVLFGLQLTYAAQNIKHLDAAEFQKTRRRQQYFLANDQTVIRLMQYVLNAFERKDQKPVSVEAVAWRFGMPVDFAGKILDHLVHSGLLCHTIEPSVGYVPSTDGAHIKLDEISRSISEVSFAQPGSEETAMQQVFEEMQSHLSRYTLKQVLAKEERFDYQADKQTDAGSGTSD
ncbi:MAG TPA: YhjD/YihY/BrkB family envelope integrity protein [Anaerohalosphaeraceae bacterium]|nr:YihY family inner membrane protein [Phycisphaerae bacterium]HOK94705.1 YhjD/YihY/BrkB family envelope integrity protein [Anaerohalosphaeraceae bacterium]HOL30577.1 YhjD/YihY/BrkB family envelope integrity protein [Anaerohalosphaeraceae bacterium]HOM75061.1 YhjD/YihY/BrkB family envelope integrity protein [Anaerohalosphaeraceae bacterium]HPC63602.1 YhjD/YihY/BrkB family envelope integrity protein [Anaerohalosphaeraceae bacterium]